MAYLLVLMLILPSLSIADTAMNDRASELSQAGQAKWGSSQALQDNLIDPMNQGSSMSTIDGQSFAANLSCATSNKFLDITAFPSSTGDFSNLLIKKDTNLDGTLESAAYTNKVVSGICGNGFISCDAGTWNNCSAYAWDLANSGNIMPTYLDKLGGCYCINNSCGQGLAFKNLKVNLTTISSGAAASISKTNPNYAITDVTVDGTTGSVYGQDTISCASATDSETIPTKYKENPTIINDDAYTASQDNELYQSLIGLNPDNNTDNYKTSCQINRTVPINEVSIEDIISYNTGAGSVRICGDDCLEIELGKQENINSRYQSYCSKHSYDVGFNVHLPDRIKSAKLTYARYNDWMSIAINNSKIYAGERDFALGSTPSPCQRSTWWNSTSTGRNKINISAVNFTPHFKTSGNKDFKIDVFYEGIGQGHAKAKIEVDTSCKLEPDSIINKCSQFEANNQCTLFKEEIDGVVTVNNFIDTGLQPLLQTRTIKGKQCSFKVHREWMQINRVYSCKGRPSYNFDSVLSKNSSSASSRNISLKSSLSVSSCTQSCKTKKLDSDRSTQSGLRAEKLTVDPYTYQYKQCTNNICPLEAGESLETDCTCMNNFSKAVGAMQSARMASQDIICSKGAKL